MHFTLYICTCILVSALHIHTCIYIHNTICTLRLVLFARINFSVIYELNDLDGIKFSYLRCSVNDVLYFTTKMIVLIIFAVTYISEKAATR